MIIALLVVTLVLSAIGGICFSIGLIPGTKPYHKKKLLDGFKALKCDDLLLSPFEYHIQILKKMNILTDDDIKKMNNTKLSSDERKKFEKKMDDIITNFDNVYVKTNDENFKKSCNDSVDEILNKKISLCKKKPDFKNKFVNLPTDILKGSDHVKKDTVLYMNKEIEKQINQYIQSDDLVLEAKKEAEEYEKKAKNIQNEVINIKINTEKLKEEAEKAKEIMEKAKKDADNIKKLSEKVKDEAEKIKNSLNKTQKDKNVAELEARNARKSSDNAKETALKAEEEAKRIKEAANKAEIARKKAEEEAKKAELEAQKAKKKAAEALKTKKGRRSR